MAESEEYSEDRPKKKGGTAEYIDPPHPIRDKVTGGGPMTGKMLKKAEGVVQKHAEQYIGRAQEQIDELVESVAIAKSETGDRKEIFEKVFLKSHDIRGLGSTFGYFLVTDIAASLCNFVESVDEYGDDVIEVVNAHVDALRGMVGNNIRGDGGKIGREILAGLAVAVEKNSPPPPDEPAD
jgi:hypothetical protein